MADTDGGGDAQVLVVEDDPEINELVGAYVQLAGYEYASALNGTAALRKVDERRPVLIVLDVMLPDVDGFEVARRLKGEERTRGIPIVMLTALDRDEHRQRSRQMGVADYLTKPFDPDRLMDAIRRNANGRKK